LAGAVFQALSDWMYLICVEKHLANLGVTEDKSEAICHATIILNIGYKTLTRDEVKDIPRNSLKDCLPYRFMCTNSRVQVLNRFQ
jgi:hypothetical protein